MSKILIVLILISMAIVPTYGQNKECILDTAKDGDIIKVHAKLFRANMRIIPTSCPQNNNCLIQLVWGDDRSLGESTLPVNRDKVFLEFERLRKEIIPDTKTDVCLPSCPKYEFEGEFEGKFEVVYPKDKPIFFTVPYQLIVTSILSFEAEEFERIDPPLEKYYEDGLKYTQSIVPTGRIIRVDNQTVTEQESD